MSAAALSADRNLARRNERRMVGVSTGVHVLVLWLLFRGGPAPDLEQLTEVSLLEPGIPAAASAPAPSAPAAPAAATESGVLRERREEVRFQRGEKRGDHVPDPQSNTAFEDRLNERLATLQRAAAVPSNAGLAVVESRTPQLATVTRPGATGSGGSGALALERGGSLGGTGTSPLALVRGPQTGSGSPQLAVAGLPASAPPAPRAAAAPVRRANLAGMSLAGPIADRPVLDVVRPVYPDWAKQDAVEGSVTLYFVVSPDGRVQENILVQKTAGFRDFDDSATQALSAWLFAPLAAGRTGDQWGTITFNFRLADAR